MAGFMKNAMSYLGMTDVVDDDDDYIDEEETAQPAPKANFDSDHTVTPMPAASSAPASSSTKQFPVGKVNRITTIHPKSYEDAQLVGRALRDGVPVVLNLTGVSEAVAYRIVDFSAGVVFGVRGSLERVTPRVFLLSPAQVNIKVEEPVAPASAHDLFAD
ncbi:cell division protein SepF [Bifidobacterium myosotis]|uniref:Cell division protein SepF n=1 Tax=Bifidobacterium myosotis TaxID=1630166 RepID=A0A261FK47_9BIFI|nr:cell division protein SepF [Bifidobacterium myosotis]OZG59529.1 cell division protein SepF [Bifidobacterium myosotis]